MSYNYLLLGWNLKRINHLFWLLQATPWHANLPKIFQIHIIFFINYSIYVIS